MTVLQTQGFLLLFVAWLLWWLVATITRDDP